MHVSYLHAYSFSPQRVSVQRGSVLLVFRWLGFITQVLEFFDTNFYAVWISILPSMLNAFVISLLIIATTTKTKHLFRTIQLN